MADPQYNTVTVPGVGDVDFPSSMSEQEMHDALVKIAPNPGERSKQAQAFSALWNPKSALEPGTPPPSLGAAVTRGLTPTPEFTQKQKARQLFNYQRAAGAREFNKQIEQEKNAVGPNGELLATTPFAPAPVKTAQEVATPLDTVMSSSERAAAREKLNRGMAAHPAEAKLLRERLSASNKAVGGGAGDESGSAALLGEAYESVAHRPILQGHIEDTLGLEPGTLDKLVMMGLAPKTTSNDLTATDTRGMRILKGVTRGAYGVASGFETPENIALMAGMALAPESALGRAAGWGFTGQMLKQGVPEIGHGIADWRSDNEGKGAEELTSGILGTGLGTLGALHGIRDLRAEAPTGEAVQTEAAPAAPVERRTNQALRDEAAQLSPEAFVQRYLTHEASGLPNQRVFEQAEHEQKADKYGYSDVDGLKYLNDTYGHAAGDALIRAKGDALREAGIDAYHVHGDEFVHRAEGPGAEQELTEKLARARTILENKDIAVPQKDGSTLHIKGATFSHGLGDSVADADDIMNKNKNERTRMGLRERGKFMGTVEVEPKAGSTPVDFEHSAVQGNVYHGSPADNITAFTTDAALLGKNTKTANASLGAFFTPRKEIATLATMGFSPLGAFDEARKPTIYTTRIALHNPLDLDNMTEEQVRAVDEKLPGFANKYEEFKRGLNNRQEPVDDPMHLLDFLGKARQPHPHADAEVNFATFAEKRGLSETEWEKAWQDKTNPTFAEWWKKKDENLQADLTPYGQAALKSLGYDGIVLKTIDASGDKIGKQPQYIVFDSKNIKILGKESMHEVAQKLLKENPPAIKPSTETDLRQSVGSLIRIKQLQAAAKDRLNVELAKLDYSNDRPIQAQHLESVAKALGVTPDSIRDNNYQLTPEQVKTLNELLKSGKKAVDLDKNHPEYPFAPKGVARLAEINEEHLRAAGVPSPKDRFSGLTESERARLKAGREGGSTTVVGSMSPDVANMLSKFLKVPVSELQARGYELTTEEIGKLRTAPPDVKNALRDMLKAKKEVAATDAETTVTQQAAERAKQIKAGKTPERLQLEHDMAQLSLERKLKGVRDTVKEQTAAWQQERTGIKEPSELAQQVAGLSARLRQSIPGELYAKEHLTTKGAETPQSTIAEEPIQSPKTAKVEQAPKAPAREPKPQGEDYKARIIEIARQVQEDHGPEAFSGLQTLMSAVASKYKSPDAINQAMYAVFREYEAGLRNGVKGPLKLAIDRLEKMPEEKPGQTLYANPIQPLWDALFGPPKTPTIAAKMPGPVSFPESPLEKFTEGLKKQEKPSFGEATKAFFANETARMAQAIQNMPSFTKDAFDKLTGLSKAAWKAYAQQGGLDPLGWLLGGRRLELTRDALVQQKFTKMVQDLHPSRARREAMVNYLQAGGCVRPESDVLAELQLKYNQFANRADLKTLRKGYLDAQNLTADEKATIAKYRAYDNFLTKQEEAQGLELQRMENYIRQVWTEGSIQRMSSEGIFHSGSFSTTASFQKMRKFMDYFEGEIAGYVPKNKDFGYLVASRARASAEVLANRALIERMYHSNAADGQKMAMPQGVGVPEGIEIGPDGKAKIGALLVKTARPATALAADGRPYVVINHPSFANWKWVSSIGDTEVMYKGSMLVHPDYAPQLKNILGPSVFRGNAIGRAALGLSAFGKQTLLIGLFHPVQLSIHFLEHAAEGSTTARTMKTLNPMADSIINLSDAKQQMLVVHGLKIADYNAESMWDEGVMSRGMANGFPIAGKFLRDLHDGMFLKYIPNIKMAMALDALERNVNRYHEKYAAEEFKNPNSRGFNDRAAASQEAQSRIYRRTAEQMNSAFGGINWEALPVNKSWQDAARLMVLAPDFLLARMQFVGDAFRPGGMESRKAFLIGAFIQYTAARAFNSAMNDGDPKWDVHDWNKFIVGRHEYSLRTVQGDLMDSMLDPRRFAEHRLNPLIMRPAIEAATQKDVFGHPVTLGQQIFDMAKNIVPMPVQGAADALGARYLNRGLRSGKEDEKIADTIMQSFGLQRRQYRSPAERYVYGIFDSLKGASSTDDLAMEQKNTFKNLRQDFIEGKLNANDLQTALEKGLLKPTQAKYLFKTATETRLTREARQLQPHEVMQAWDKATPTERMELMPIAFSAIRKLPPEEQDAAYTKVGGWADTLPEKKQQALFEKAQDELNYEYPPPAEPEEDKQENQ